jgi:hypothetical protein
MKGLLTEEWVRLGEPSRKSEHSGNGKSGKLLPSLGLEKQSGTSDPGGQLRSWNIKQRRITTTPL